VDRRTWILVIAVAVSAVLSITLRSVVFAEATWWPMLMIVMLGAALFLYLWRQRSRRN
jgi:uncharacterized membrane protein